jgi:RNA pol II promoter Fmp27 protein domain
LRDQGDDSIDDHQFPKGAAAVTHAAMQALRKTLSRDSETPPVVNMLDDPVEDLTLPGLDPLDGWSEGVSLDRSHFCVLLKPQIVLSSETDADSVCVVAAGLAKLQTNAIMDDSNADDPISGRVMNRYGYSETRSSEWTNSFMVIEHIRRCTGCKHFLLRKLAYLRMDASQSKS